MRHSQDLVHVVVGELQRLLHERRHLEKGGGHQDGEDVAGIEEGSRLGGDRALPLLSLPLVAISGIVLRFEVVLIIVSIVLQADIPF